MGNEKKHRLFVSGGQTEDLRAAVRYLAESVSRGVLACIPAVVLEYNDIKHVVKVQPLVKNIMIDDDGKVRDVETEPFEIPVRFPCFGGFGINIPLSSGEKGWVFASDVDTIQLRRKEMDYTKLGGIPEKNMDKKDVQDDLPQKANVLMSHFYDHGFFFPDCWAGFDVTKIQNRLVVSDTAKTKILAEQSEAMRKNRTRHANSPEDDPEPEFATSVNDVYFGSATDETYERDRNWKEKKRETWEPTDQAGVTIGKGRIAATQIYRPSANAAMKEHGLKFEYRSGTSLFVEKENSVVDEYAGQPSVSIITKQIPNQERCRKEREAGEREKFAYPRGLISLIGSTGESEDAKIVIEVASSEFADATGVLGGIVMDAVKPGYHDVVKTVRIEISIPRRKPPEVLITATMPEGEDKTVVSRLGGGILGAESKFRVSADGVCIDNAVDYQYLAYTHPLYNKRIITSNYSNLRSLMKRQTVDYDVIDEGCQMVRFLFGKGTADGISYDGLKIITGLKKDVTSGMVGRCSVLSVDGGGIKMRARMKYIYDKSTPYTAGYYDGNNLDPEKLVQEGREEEEWSTKEGVGMPDELKLEITGSGIDLEDAQHVKMPRISHCGGKKVGICAYYHMREGDVENEMKTWDKNFYMYAAEEEPECLNRDGEP